MRTSLFLLSSLRELHSAAPSYNDVWLALAIDPPPAERQDSAESEWGFFVDLDSEPTPPANLRKTSVVARKEDRDLASAKSFFRAMFAWLSLSASDFGVLGDKLDPEPDLPSARLPIVSK